MRYLIPALALLLAAPAAAVSISSPASSIYMRGQPLDGGPGQYELTYSPAPSGPVSVYRSGWVPGIFGQLFHYEYGTSAEVAWREDGVDAAGRMYVHEFSRAETIVDVSFRLTEPARIHLTAALDLFYGGTSLGFTTASFEFRNVLTESALVEHGGPGSERIDEWFEVPAGRYRFVGYTEGLFYDTPTADTFGEFAFSVTAHPLSVPEPGTLALVALGLAALSGRRLH